MSEKKLKQEIGMKLRMFREAIGKTQAQLAEEVQVYQSTITNMEIGRIFPGIKYLHYYHHTYGLNINWLLRNKGEMFTTKEERNSKSASLLECHVKKRDTRYQRYKELVDLMKLPGIEKIMLAKLVEIKVIFKEEIREFLENKQVESEGT